MYSTLFSKRLIIYLLLIFSSVVCFAQEYKYEIGVMAGGSFYMGDLNKTIPFKRTLPAGGLVFRYNPNLRMSLKTNLLWGMISGSTSGMTNSFPSHAYASFERSLFDLGGQFEFNFLPYSDKYEYKSTSRLTPYVFAGVGVTFASGDINNFLGINLPLGVGVKYKIKNRVNLSLELSIRKLFADKLDVTDSDNKWLDDPYHMKGSFMKNKDWYSFMLFSVTWDFGPKYMKCNHIESF